MSKRVCFAMVAMLAPVAARADKKIDDVEQPDKRAPFASWTAVQQWMPVMGNGHDPRNDYGYASLSGSLLLADELGDRFSELGRASLLDHCFKHMKADVNEAALAWAMCGPDAKALDVKKLEGELAAGGISAESKAKVMEEVKEIVDNAKKIGDAVESAAKDDPGLQKLLKLTDVAKAEWATYIGKNKADYERYLALKDAVRSGKSNNKGFAGCWEQTYPAFTKIVKANASKVPWDPGNDPLVAYMKFMLTTTEGYVASVAFGACAYSIHESGEAVYVAAANTDFGGGIHAGWRTNALAKALDPELKLKFADRSLSIHKWEFQWKYGVKMEGVNEITAIQTPTNGEMGKVSAKDDETTVRFKADKVESCLQWKETNKVSQVNNGNVSYEKVCVKRGMVDNDSGSFTTATKFAAGLKAGDSVTVVHNFPVVTWKAKKINVLLGVPLK